MLEIFHNKTQEIMKAKIRNPKERNAYLIELSELMKKMEVPADTYQFYNTKMPDDAWKELEKVKKKAMILVKHIKYLAIRVQFALIKQGMFISLYVFVRNVKIY